MDMRKLSDADKYLLYGLLLRKRRSAEAERQVLEIMRSSLSLDGKIEAILKLHEETPVSAGEEGLSLSASSDSREPARRKRRKQAVVLDPYPEVTRLLSKCSLRWDLDFSQAGSRKQALYLVRKLRAGLVICNLNLPPEEYPLLYEEACKRQRNVKIVFLCPTQPEDPVEDSPAFKENTRLVPKPINLDRLESAVRELLGDQ